jgi:hypothetical protein
MYTGSEALKQAIEAKQLALAEQTGLDNLSGDLKAKIAEAQEKRRSIAQELAAVYLVDLTEEAMAIAEQRSGFSGFSRMRPLQAMANEATRLSARVRTIEGDEQYRRREYLIGTNGSITRELAEARDLLAPWEEAAHRFESLPSFQELLDTGYDTPQFSIRWWEPTYWKLWARGDAACKALGLNDFGDDVLPAWREVSVPRDQWRQQVASIQARYNAVADLVQEHDSAQLRIQQLPQIYLAEARKALTNHILRAETGILESWAGEDRALLIGLRSIAGLDAKIFAWEDMLRGSQNLRVDLDERLATLETKIHKLQRPKKLSTYYMGDLPPEKLVQRVGQHAQSRQKLSQNAEKVRAFDDYGSVPAEVPPQGWYVVMVGKTPNGHTPRLHEWYAQNPNYQVPVDPYYQHSLGEAIAVEVAGELIADGIERAFHSSHGSSLDHYDDPS